MEDDAAVGERLAMVRAFLQVAAERRRFFELVAVAVDGDRLRDNVAREFGITPERAWTLLSAPLYHWTAHSIERYQREEAELSG